MREIIGTRMSFSARLLCVCAGGGPLVFLFVLLCRIDPQDHLNLILVLLISLWLVGTAWVLAAKANEVNGWGQIELSEALFVPLITLLTVFGLFFMLFIVALGQMH